MSHRGLLPEKVGEKGLLGENCMLIRGRVSGRMRPYDST